MVHELATDVNTTEVPLVVHIILKQSVLLLVVHILYALVGFTVVVLESVQGVADVTPM